MQSGIPPVVLLVLVVLLLLVDVVAGQEPLQPKGVQAPDHGPFGQVGWGLPEQVGPPVVELVPVVEVPVVEVPLVLLVVLLLAKPHETT